MHFQQSTQRTSKMGLGEVKRVGKERQAERVRGEAQIEVTLERNHKLEWSNRNRIVHSGN